jgi:hypothetical protein
MADIEGQSLTIDELYTDRGYIIQLPSTEVGLQSGVGTDLARATRKRLQCDLT